MPAALKAIQGYLARRVLVLPASGPFVIGRSPGADLPLYGPDIDERHLVLVPDGAGHRAVPTSPRAVTRVGGEPLQAPRPLRDGDELRVGGHVFTYAAAAPPLAAAAGAASCATCGQPTDAGAAGALALARGVICPRCVDRRLHAQRDLATFRVLKKLGGNGEEVNYLALDREEHEEVVLRLLKTNKQADPRCVRRFIGRALVGMALEHPNFVTVRGVHARGGICFVVLDHHGGQKLERLAREKAPIGGAAALVIVNQLAAVLQHARERRLVVAKRRRTGVVVDRRLWVKVRTFDLTHELEATATTTAAFHEVAERCGFDPAALAAAGPSSAARARDEARLFRLAPEVDEVGSLGRLLFQLLAGRPYQPGPAVEALRAARTRPRPGAPGLEGVPPAVLGVLGRLIIATAPDRITTLDALGHASTKVLGELDAPAALESGDLDLEVSDDDVDDVEGSSA
jgi:hypothetical protein